MALLFNINSERDINLKMLEAMRDFRTRLVQRAPLLCNIALIRDIKFEQIGINEDGQCCMESTTRRNHRKHL